MSDEKDRFRVALVQMRSGRDVRENLLEAEAFIRDAARKGAQFIQTPENTLLMETETARLFERIAPEEATESHPALFGPRQEPRHLASYRFHRHQGRRKARRKPGLSLRSRRADRAPI